MSTSQLPATGDGERRVYSDLGSYMLDAGHPVSGRQEELLNAYASTAVQEAVDKEREACALICDGYYGGVPQFLAKSIRERSLISSEREQEKT